MTIEQHVKLAKKCLEQSAHHTDIFTIWVRLTSRSRYHLDMAIAKMNAECALCGPMLGDEHRPEEVFDNKLVTAEKAQKV